mmetsp:Transcript_6419/g.29346  ORF Transcript_6419/g.29346 Transcript_6419/m.29346 type:complete len:276 (-) Transcript_6419:1458-2285(-)
MKRGGRTRAAIANRFSRDVLKIETPRHLPGHPPPSAVGLAVLRTSPSASSVQSLADIVLPRNPAIVASCGASSASTSARVRAASFSAKLLRKIRSCATSSSTHLRNPTSLRCIAATCRSSRRAASPVGLNPTGDGAPLVMPSSAASRRASPLSAAVRLASSASSRESSDLAASNGVFASDSFARGFTPGATAKNIFQNLSPSVLAGLCAGSGSGAHRTCVQSPPPCSNKNLKKAPVPASAHAWTHVPCSGACLRICFGVMALMIPLAKLATSGWS